MTFHPSRQIFSVVFLFSFLALAATSSSTPAPTGLAYTRTTWNTTSGLPENTVQALLESPSGSLWVGTSGGLATLDGGPRLQPSNLGQAGVHSVFCMAFGPDNSLWIGTEGEGLLRVRGGEIKSYSTTQGLTDGFVRSILKDSEGGLWVGTDDGLFRLERDRLVRVDNTAAMAPIAVHSIAEDSQHRIWVGGSRLIAILPRGGVETFSLPGDYSENRVKKILQTADGTIWVGTVGGLAYLRDGRFQTLPGISATVRALLETRDGTLWIGTIGSGLWNWKSGRLTAVPDPDILPSQTILSILQDSYGQVWLGTQAGLVRLDRTPVHLIFLPGAGDPDFETISGDASGNVWVAAQSLYLIRNGIAHPQLYPQLHGAGVRNIYRARDGSLWIGTDGSGAFHLHGDQVTHYTAPAQLTNNFVRAFLESRSGDMWIATDEGLTRIGAHGVQLFRESSGLAFFSTRALLEDRDGGIWIGTDRGVSLWRDGSFRHNAITQALQGEKIWSLLQDRQGILWFGTRDNGIFRDVHGTVEHLGVNDGLPANSVYQILQDASGTFWISGANTIASIPETPLSAPGHLLNFTTYSMPFGAEDAQIYGGRQPAGFVAPDGSVWFPTSRGAAHIVADAQPLVGPPPQAVIDTLDEDGRAVPLTAGLSIPAGVTRIGLQFSSIYLRSQSQVRLRYRLQGFDRDWISAGANGIASYTNLRSGHYVFRVQVFDARNPAAFTEASLSFIRKPFFYQTWWFYTLCAAILAASAWLVYRIRLNQVRSRFSAVLEERNRLAREMHDTVIQGCIGVSALLEAVATRNPEHDDLIDVAREQAQGTINEARRALWDMRNEKVAVVELIEALRAMAAQTLQEHPGIRVDVTAIASLPLPPSIAHELLMTIREALNNAAQHSGSDHIHLHVAFDRQVLKVAIEDRGSGFDGTAPIGHYGLLGMRERMERLGGRFDLTAVPGQGTSVQLSLRLPAPSNVR